MPKAPSTPVPVAAARPLAPAVTQPPGRADLALLNYALNLQYLAAQFYSYAATGSGVSASLIDGTGSAGDVRNGHRVPFHDPVVARYASELAEDKLATLASLRTLTAAGAVPQPHIDLAGPTAALPAPAAADPFADDASFLSSALVFEDASVHVFRDLRSKIDDDAGAAIVGRLLADATYHAGLLRTTQLGHRSATGADAIGSTAAENPSGAASAVDGAASDPAACAGDRPPQRCLDGAMAALARYFPNDVNGTIKLNGDQS